MAWLAAALSSYGLAYTCTETFSQMQACTEVLWLWVASNNVWCQTDWPWLRFRPPCTASIYHVRSLKSFSGTLKTRSELQTANPLQRVTADRKAHCMGGVDVQCIAHLSIIILNDVGKASCVVEVPRK
jgi:hypothetical protein